MTFKIVLANKVHDTITSKLEPFGQLALNETDHPYTRDDLLKNCADAHALMAFMTETIDEAFLEACPNLRIIAGALKGYNNIDVDACSKYGVIVTIVPDLLTEPTAELTIGLMISVARKVIAGDQFIRQEGFQGWRPKFYGGSIQGSTIAVLGAGAVGQAILKMLKGFDCKKLYVDKEALSPQMEHDLETKKVSLEEAQKTADFIILALHLMPETFHLINQGFITSMKPGSYLINPARGSLVDESVIADALEQGHLAGYAADTFEMEDWAVEQRPRTINERLLTSNKTVLTPHIGSAVRAVREEIERSAACSIISLIKGTMPDTAVNNLDLKIVGQEKTC